MARSSKPATTVIAGMTVSLDGFVARPDGSVEALCPELQEAPYLTAMQEETGAAP